MNWCGLFAHSESPAAHRLAYEWLLKRHPELEDDLIPDMLLDPSPEFRRDAVARLIDEAKQATGDAASDLWRGAQRRRSRGSGENDRHGPA